MIAQKVRFRWLDALIIAVLAALAVFIGYGVWTAGEAAMAALASARNGFALGRFHAGRAAATAAAAMASVVLLFSLLPPAISLAREWKANDQSENTGINDFYENVFEMLPQGSTLIGRGGVFGYDMFYWRYVYNVRPDVYIPLAVRFDNSRAPQGRPTYTITPPNGQGGFGGPSPAPRTLQSVSAWYVPVIAAPVQSESGGFQFQRQILLAGFDDPAIQHHVHHVRLNVIQQPLIVRDDDDSPLG